MSNIPSEALKFGGDIGKLNQQYDDPLNQLRLEIEHLRQIRYQLLLDIDSSIPPLEVTASLIRRLDEFALKMNVPSLALRQIYAQINAVENNIGHYQGKERPTKILYQLAVVLRNFSNTWVNAFKRVSKRRDSSINYLIKVNEFPIVWKIRGTDHNRKWQKVFERWWFIRNQRSKKILKEQLGIYIMPLEVSWHYFACAMAQQFFHDGIWIEDVPYKLSQIAETILKLKLLSGQEDDLLYTFTNMVYNCSVQIVPFSRKTHEQIFGHDYIARKHSSSSTH